jgi:hypothetical protein
VEVCGAELFNLSGTYPPIDRFSHHKRVCYRWVSNQKFDEEKWFGFVAVDAKSKPRAMSGTTPLVVNMMIVSIFQWTQPPETARSRLRAESSRSAQ